MRYHIDWGFEYGFGVLMRVLQIGDVGVNKVLH